MAKKQTRRSISVSRTTYERLKAFCEANNISMSQLVETRVNDFLGEGVPLPATRGTDRLAPPAGGSTEMAPRPRPIAPMPSPVPAMPRPTSHQTPAAPASPTTPTTMGSTSPLKVAGPAEPVVARPAPPVPMTSAAARYAVEPPPPIIKPKQDTNAPKPAEKRPDQIFTF